MNSVTEIIKYTAASAAALALDYCIYWILAGLLGTGIGLSAAAGYATGLGLAFILLSNGVFARRRTSRGRIVELGLFGLSGLLGLVLTYATATLVSEFTDGNIHMSKLSAVTVSFVIVYMFRKFVVFRDRSRG